MKFQLNKQREKGIRVEFNENKPIIMTFPIIIKEK